MIPELLSGQHVQEAKRKGKIFLDYLRNDRMSTAVAVLSPPCAPRRHVSMPLTWTQVRGDLDRKKLQVAHRAGAAGEEQGVGRLMRTRRRRSRRR